MGESLKSYSDFLKTKKWGLTPSGISDGFTLNKSLFQFQSDIVKWALRLGRAAIFADCGMGKTFMQLEWARCIPGKVLILAPLAVAQQTVREGEKFGIKLEYAKRQSESTGKIVVSNYERLDSFDPSSFDGIVLDESSILKSFDGKTRIQLIESFSKTPYRLACTATPSPNDYMELGNHSEFLGILKRSEMLSMFFVHDMDTTQEWRLKGHARSEFWKWVCSWGVMLRKPSDVGYSDDGFILPPIEYKDHCVEIEKPSEGFLFRLEAQGLSDRLIARKESVDDRVAACFNIVNQSDGSFIVWCHLNSESAKLKDQIKDAVEIVGSDSSEEKERKIGEFLSGKMRVLITKPSISGFGLNLQLCHQMAFVGLSDSYEELYQAVRRCWRFGQKKKVIVYLIHASSEGSVLANVKKKEKKAEEMSSEMVKSMSEIEKVNLHGGSKRTEHVYSEDSKSGDLFEMRLGDAVEVLKGIETGFIHYSIFSPPFASLYTYSNSERDLGNCKNHEEFFEHFRFVVEQLHRVIMSGRLVSVHCMNLPTSKTNHGFIGIRDFRGDIIRLFESIGFIFHSEVVIWKDPVTAMQRTKALGLLHKQIKKDSTMSRQGIPDFLCTFRKHGENPEKVSHTNESFPVSLWQNYASPVWMDISPSNTLQYRSVREHEDEKHICPLQLQVIERAIRLWTNPNDLVLSPFAGIGSEGYISLKEGRRFLGVELKRSYFEQATRNLSCAEEDVKSKSLFKDMVLSNKEY